MLGRIATLVVVVAALGCGGRGGSFGDGGVEGTVPLDGSVACYDKTCASGQLCSSCPIDPDGSAGQHGSCHDVPAGCVVVECTYGECPTCVTALCGGTGGTVKGRTLGCPCLQ